MESKSSLIIADLQTHALGGHFSVWLDRVVEQASRHFEQVGVYVVDAKSVPSINIHECSVGKIAINLIPRLYHTIQWSGDILGLISRHHAALNHNAALSPVFLMWAQQFVERDIIFPPRKNWIPWRKSALFKAPWATITSVSSLCHDLARAPEMEHRIHDMLHAETDCVGALLWDEYAVMNLGGKYSYLPDVENCDIDPDWMLSDQRFATIGSVGQLWGGRSVNLLAELLETELSFQGYLGGVLKPESYTEKATHMIKYAVNITLEEGFLDRDEELNNRLRKLDAFLIDSRTYKCPSGLAIRAMALGRPIVTIDSPSWISNLIKEHGVGVFWDQQAGSLKKMLHEWFKSGGSQRSMEAARSLNDQRGMEQSFAEMFSRLKRASAA